MRFSPHAGRRRQEAEINVTSLVDIIFNLLLFFMLTTSFSQSAGLQVDLPSAAAADVRIQSDDLIIIVTDQGQAMVNGVVKSADELRATMETYRAEHPKGTVILQADQSVPHGKVVDIINQAKSLNIRSVSIATEG